MFGRIHQWTHLGLMLSVLKGQLLIDYWFNLSYRHRPIQVFYFLFVWVLANCVFKELVHFIYVIKFVGIELFTVFLHYAFNVHEICTDVQQMYFIYIPWVYFKKLNLCYTHLVMVVNKRQTRKMSIISIWSKTKRKNKYLYQNGIQLTVYFEVI